MIRFFIKLNERYRYTTAEHMALRAQWGSVDSDEDIAVLEAEEDVLLHRLRSAFLQDTAQVNNWSHVRVLDYNQLLKLANKTWVQS